MIATIVEVWSAVMAQITATFADITELFYADGALTFIGTLAVIMAGIGLLLLVFNLIRSFFVMRG